MNKPVTLNKAGLEAADEWYQEFRGSNYSLIKDTIVVRGIIDAYLNNISHHRADGWQKIDSAPRDESLFLLRHKTKQTVVEAAFYWDQEFCDGHAVTERYECLHDMTNDKPIDQDWEDFEWQPLPPTQAPGV